MKTLMAMTALLMTVTPALSQSKTEGRALAELAFESVDVHERGYVDQGDMDDFGESIRYSMDANDDGKITEEEFLGWDFGFSELAAREDKELAYRTAIRVVFSFQDRDADGEISRIEWRKAGIRDFRQADLNDDALLSEEEFLGGFPIINAIKAALKPE